MKMVKSVSGLEAISAIEPGNKVFIGEGCGEPQTLVEALVEDKFRLKGTQIFEARYVPGSKYHEMWDFFHITTFHVFPDLVEAINEGKVDFLPLKLSEMHWLFSRGKLPIDVALIQVSPPDKDGYFNLGVSVGFTKDAALSAKKVIAEVNDRMPRTFGNTKFPMDHVDYIVETSRPLIEHQSPKIGEVEMGVAKNVCKLIEDGSTLCLGIGSIPEAIAGSLHGKSDLGIHGGLITDGIMWPMKQGIVTNSRKSIDKGKTVAGFILGTKDLFEFVNDNPAVEVHANSYTHSIETIRHLVHFTAITSAVNIDLTGQVNAEFMNNKQISTVGGQADLFRGAGLSKGGKSIIAMTSTAKKKEVSRILPQFSEGTAVTTPRYDIHYIVTEYGIAELWGKSLSQRAEALISIAHPRFRDQLRDSLKMKK